MEAKSFTTIKKNGKDGYGPVPLWKVRSWALEGQWDLCWPKGGDMKSTSKVWVEWSCGTAGESHLLNSSCPISRFCFLHISGIWPHPSISSTTAASFTCDLDYDCFPLRGLPFSFLALPLHSPPWRQNVKLVMFPDWLQSSHGFSFFSGEKSMHLAWSARPIEANPVPTSPAHFLLSVFQPHHPYFTWSLLSHGLCRFCSLCWKHSSPSLTPPS